LHPCLDPSETILSPKTKRGVRLLSEETPDLGRRCVGEDHARHPTGSPQISLRFSAPLRRARRRGGRVLALAPADTGREREALSPHLPRYQRSLGNYARDLREPG